MFPNNNTNPFGATKEFRTSVYNCPDCDITMQKKDKDAHIRGRKHREVAGISDVPLFDPSKYAKKTDPRACHNCGQLGHKGKDCNVVKCRNCDGLGHEKTDCLEPPNPKNVKCNLCEQSELAFFSSL
ncbi:hypothetical protein K402DRAFT_228912 [Aulographum hederae CBS 113979]|uniref:CCHC-type domain-containing protein n=1 Tax=Aulographum hederae CBS 113979 TaxID=1176131 RepID=A0A6G1HBL1_9PEZI|nr:hypothetical protein K402DRAFT_228912 [Aulographum hederae CBS 113979]